MKFALFGNTFQAKKSVHIERLLTILQKHQAERLLSFCSNAGPAFLFGMLSGFFPEKKTLWMLGAAVVLALVAWIFNDALPVNKKLWSSTFVCAVGAYSLIMMALFYYLVDVRGWRKWTFVFRIVGMNSITIYMAQRIVEFSGISKFFFGGLAGLCPEDWGHVILSAGFIVVCWYFLYFLYRQKIFLKI